VKDVFPTYDADAQEETALLCTFRRLIFMKSTHTGRDRKMVTRKVALAIIGISLVGAAIAQSIQCPIDKGSMFATGRTKVEMGKMLYEYRCASGHVTWVVQ
jgi:hypothetical protein